MQIVIFPYLKQKCPPGRKAFGREAELRDNEH